MLPPLQRPSNSKRLFFSKKEGFTLIELLVVITVIAILAAITLNIAGGVNQKATMDKARAEIAAISNALEQFKSVRDHYPTNATIEEEPLIMNSSINSIQPFYADTKYLTNKDGHLLDPYGNAYNYKHPGDNNPASFDLWSDGESAINTDDDIRNW